MNTFSLTCSSEFVLFCLKKKLFCLYKILLIRYIYIDAFLWMGELVFFRTTQRPICSCQQLNVLKYTQFVTFQKRKVEFGPFFLGCFVFTMCCVAWFTRLKHRQEILFSLHSARLRTRNNTPQKSSLCTFRKYLNAHLLSFPVHAHYCFVEQKIARKSKMLAFCHLLWCLTVFLSPVICLRYLSLSLSLSLTLSVICWGIWLFLSAFLSFTEDSVIYFCHLLYFSLSLILLFFSHFLWYWTVPLSHSQIFCCLVKYLTLSLSQTFCHLIFFILFFINHLTSISVILSNENFGLPSLGNGDKQQKRLCWIFSVSPRKPSELPYWNPGSASLATAKSTTFVRTPMPMMAHTR